MCQADVFHLDTWVEWDVCHGWYHCLCTGLSHAAAEKMKYQCCSLNCSTSVARLEGCTISVGEIKKVRNEEDLSGDAIDFFMRHLMSNDKHLDLSIFCGPTIPREQLAPNSLLEEAIPWTSQDTFALV
ncbi:uncharacterized protein LOC110990736 [Acanthaster planci]|uniref:Uncharacterized protein LOC110990736 n=1 Tax=Acanthaster planci TaxID=133434 RepID=A0A8B8A3L3_ACAPL|nr:uncharacterized protein LOC110990736 [Acanthaster planci]